MLKTALIILIIIKSSVFIIFVKTESSFFQAILSCANVLLQISKERSKTRFILKVINLNF